MNHTTNPQDAVTAAVYDALVSFQQTAGWPQLALAQMRQHLAEHVAAALPSAVVSADRATLRAACVCGEPGTPGSVHRTDGPCYVDDRRRSIANAIARVDAGKWGTEVPLESHPFWQIYLAYADAVQELLDATSRVAAEEQPAETQDDFTESVIYEVVGNWGVDSADSAEEARTAVAKWLRAYPKCGAHAQQRIYRDWPDGSEYYGPWTDLPAVGEQPAGKCPCGHPHDEHSVYGCIDGCGCDQMFKRPAETQIREISNDCCGAEPPAEGTWGDCWCTLPPGHEGEHQCQPCTDRHGAPGWTVPAP